MRNRGQSGIWELFVPDIGAGNHYKYEIRSRRGDVFLKADPYAQQWQLRPETACIIVAEPRYAWRDAAWMKTRADYNWQHRPMAVYEVHLGSWMAAPDGKFLNYRDIAEQLAAYASEMGFTHVELLPVTEHPLDASWGYQTTGYFAPTSRFGTPDDFRWFVDHLHENGIGVLLDWVPAHFPRDDYALARFDGTPLYEHADPRRGEHRDWGTLIFNYGRNEVRNFLLASALYWLEEFHIDGLRVDAVASMLYLDYSREPGDWVPNEYGGRENLEAVAFLRDLNTVVHERFPGAVVVAEESTAWPQVSRPTWLGGLGFSMKWNMGWMHDMLAYLAKDPVHRHYHHDLLTFGLLYAFSENFVLPFSHDEVVHGKGSMINKMPGDSWQQFASLRLLYAMQWTYPGKKLLFMGCEFAQRSEWDHAACLEWELLQHESHGGVRQLLVDLNGLYREDPALYAHDFEFDGFEWIDCHDASQSVLSYLRKDDDGHYTAVLLNFTPVVRERYRIGLPVAGTWDEVLNTDAAVYWGSNIGNGGAVSTDETPWMGRPQSAQVVLPPLGAVVLRYRGAE
jgi:1,4-alpha-glucan branching enzyme